MAKRMSLYISYFCVAIIFSIQCQSSGFEIRASLKSKDLAQQIIESHGAICKGDYVFTDYIYDPGCINLNKEYIRLRIYQKTNWPQKKCVLMHKQKNDAGSKITLHEEFDCPTEAFDFIELHTCNLYCSYSRTGTEYELDGMRIFLEEIENLPLTIELLSNSIDQIQAFLRELPVVNTFTDSVPALVQKAKAHA